LKNLTNLNLLHQIVVQAQDQVLDQAQEALNLKTSSLTISRRLVLKSSATLRLTIKVSNMMRNSVTLKSLAMMANALLREKAFSSWLMMSLRILGLHP
jgi:hypothetical protein